MTSSNSIDVLAGFGHLFPEEIWHHVFTFVPKPRLSQLRLVSRQFDHICTPLAFEAFNLSAHDNSASRFMQIAASRKLRELVRELTIDTWVGTDFNYNSNEDYPEPVEFMNALHYVQFFTEVRALHLRFNEFCEKQASIDATAEELYWLEPEYPPEHLQLPVNKSIKLKELDITNLADYHDIDLVQSEAWSKLMSSQSIIDLKIYIAAEENPAAPGMPVYYEENYDMFERMPQTWLCPDVSENLRVLSLYYRSYWGWFPKMDFRLIGTNGKPFPQLKVLALGNYVFSHDWQIDWFPSLGKMNGSGGVEELYLDDCPILLEARQIDPLDYNDPLYPVASVVVAHLGEREVHNIPLRWHKVLSRWRESMKGLKVFRMGHGSWNGPPEAAEQSVNDDESSTHAGGLALDHIFCNNAHRTFNFPEVFEDGTSDEIYAQGAGLSCTRDNRLQYISYDIGIGPTRQFDDHDSSGRPKIFGTEGTAEKDDHAYEMLMSTISSKRASTL